MYNEYFKKFKDPYPNFSQLLNEVQSILDKNTEIYDMFACPDGQLAVQTNDPTKTDWYAGIGRAKGKFDWEKTFCYMQPDLMGGEIEKYFNWLEVPVYRARIMLSRPKSSYSIHCDFSPRLHFPLITNTQCNFLFTQPEKLIHMPADGTTYWTDTRQYHTFFNGSLENRFHLVMIVAE